MRTVSRLANVEALANSSRTCTNAFNQSGVLLPTAVGVMTGDISQALKLALGYCGDALCGGDTSFAARLCNMVGAVR